MRVAMSGLKLLLTQRKLAEYAGSEMVTLELALALKARGHEVAVFCPRPGKLTDVLASNGIANHEHVREVPWRPDVIHAHHRLPALTALTHFAGVPCVYLCHGQRPWVEQPPLHPQIGTYLAVSEKLANHIATRLDLPRERVRSVRNFVDIGRFSRVRTPSAEAPTRALLFGQSGFSDGEVERLEEACGRHGIALDKIGYAYGNPRPNPELYLPDYDIVFAIGRSALEAMACGCNTIPLVPVLAGSLVTGDNFEAWADINFSPRYFTTADRVSDEWLAAQLTRLDPQDAARVTHRVRTEFSLESVVTNLEAIYGEAMAAPVASDADGSALVDALVDLAREADEIWEQSPAAQGATPAASLSAQELRDVLNLARTQSGSLRDLVRSLYGLVTTQSPEPEEAGPPSSPASAIAKTGLFDGEWYLAQNPDVADAGFDPLEHYLLHGGAEGRAPSPFFDAAAWLEANPHLRDLARAAGLSPLELVVNEAARAGPAVAPAPLPGVPLSAYPHSGD
ncbi:MAG: hypothetical protein AcusKO_48480 [Acuticoccus sp.]